MQTLPGAAGSSEVNRSAACVWFDDAKTSRRTPLRPRAAMVNPAQSHRSKTKDEESEHKAPVVTPRSALRAVRDEGQCTNDGSKWGVPRQWPIPADTLVDHVVGGVDVVPGHGRPASIGVYCRRQVHHYVEAREGAGHRRGVAFETCVRMRACSQTSGPL